MVEFYVEPDTTTIPLGRQGENLARTIYFELSELISNYGEGTATLVYLRNKDSAPYVCDTTQSGNMLSWTPTSTDTAYSGSGKCELRWVVGETLAKSVIYTTAIAQSITADTELPDQYQSWIDAMDAVIIDYADSVLAQALETYLENNAQALRTLTLDLGGSTYVYDGTEDIAIVLADADTTAY